MQLLEYFPSEENGPVDRAIIRRDSSVHTVLRKVTTLMLMEKLVNGADHTNRVWIPVRNIMGICQRELSSNSFIAKQRLDELTHMGLLMVNIEYHVRDSSVSYMTSYYGRGCLKQFAEGDNDIIIQV